MYNDIIYDAEDIIGFSWDIAGHIKDDPDFDDDLKQELLDELEQHDGLVICHACSMGGYDVCDLIEA